ncbi:putative kelch-type beta propeller [Helianthus anomalus]
MKFNVQKNCWTMMKKMITSRSFFASGVINRRVALVVLCFRGQIYDLKTDHWEDMPNGLREGWMGLSAVIYGHLFVVTEHERTKLKVYDTNNDSWRTVDEPPLPEQICKPFSVNCNNSKIYVVGRNLHVIVGCILRLNTENNQCFSVQVHMISSRNGMFLTLLQFCMFWLVFM